MIVSNIFRPLYVILTFSQNNIVTIIIFTMRDYNAFSFNKRNRIFKKNPKTGGVGVEDILFWKRPLKLLDFLLYHMIFLSPLEIPLLFYSVDPWNFHILFFQYPWKVDLLKPLFGFFLE